LDSELQDLYNEKLLALAERDPLSGRLDAPQASVKVVSPLCGSRITVDLSLSGGKVADYAQVVRACTLGRASATVMAEHVLGRTPEELRRQRESMQGVLKRGETPPAEAWPEIELFLPAKDFKSRHGSVMLAFDAVVKALDQIENADAEPSAG
jgi:NifU-like protein involved in Fe-S cluster formation